MSAVVFNKILAVLERIATALENQPQWYIPTPAPRVDPLRFPPDDGTPKPWANPPLVVSYGCQTIPCITHTQTVVGTGARPDVVDP